MSVSEIAFHDLTRVNVEWTGSYWLDVELVNEKGQSISLTIFGNKKQMGVFNALANCLNAEFNPGEPDEKDNRNDFLAELDAIAKR